MFTQMVILETTHGVKLYLNPMEIPETTQGVHQAL